MGSNKIMNENNKTQDKGKPATEPPIPERQEKKIVTLGLSGSGKTNYVAAALVYMAMYDYEQGQPFDEFGPWKISISRNRTMKVTNQETFRVIDNLVSDCFQRGKWCRKTTRGTCREFTFDLRGNVALWPPCIRRPKSIVIRDWAGESFSAILDGSSTKDKIELFRKDCAEADGFILCLDGEFLIDNAVKRRMKECIEGFCQVVGWLQNSNSDSFARSTAGEEKNRNFAIVITKADALIGIDKYTVGRDTKIAGDTHGASGSMQNKTSQLLSLKTLWDEIYSTYPAFFHVLRDRRCGVKVFPVSLVPSQKFREDNPDLGRIPSRQWKLKDVMESSLVAGFVDSEDRRYYNNMCGAFYWLLDNV